MKRSLIIAVMLTGVLWPSAGQAKIKVVATLADLGWIAAEVGGDDVDVDVLCPGHRDPHTLPAKPSLARKMRKADLLVYNGLELEIGWLPLLVDAARNPRLRPGQRGELNCSLALGHDGVLDVPHGHVDRSQGDIHPLGNPHYLLDPRLGVEVGRLMAERLAELDPAAGQRYRQRAEAFAAKVAERLPVWESRLRGQTNRQVIVYHQQWEYLTHWLDLEIIATIENRPGISPAPRHLEHVIGVGKTRQPLAIMGATWDHVGGISHVAERTGCRAVILPGSTRGTDEAASYLDVFDIITQRLSHKDGGTH